MTNSVEERILLSFSHQTPPHRISDDIVKFCVILLLRRNGYLVKPSVPERKTTIADKAILSIVCATPVLSLK